MTGVSLNHTQLQQASVLQGRVCGLALEGAEGLDGRLHILHGHIGAAQLIEALSVVGRGGRCLQRGLQDGNFAAVPIQQAAGHAGAVHRVQVVLLRILVDLPFVGVQGGLVVCRKEIAVCYARLGIGLHLRADAFHILAKPLERLLVIAFLEEGVAQLVRDEGAFRAAVQGLQVVEVLEFRAGIGPFAVPVEAFCQVIAAELVEAVLLGAVVGGRFQKRRGHSPAAGFHQFPGPQEVRLHVVGLHAGVQLVDVVVGVHGGLVVVIGEGRHRHIGVDGVVPFLVALEVLREGLGVLTQVEGQLGVVVEGIFLDIGLIGVGRCLLEGRHGRHLVVQLDVAEAHLVAGNLAQGIRPVPHLEEAVHGALPVAGKVRYLSGAEDIAPGLPFPVQAFLVVFLGLFHVTPHQEALAEDLAHAGLAVFGHLPDELFPVADHIVVVLVVEAALQDVEAGGLPEAVIVLALVEPPFGLLKIGLGVVDVAQGEGGRGGEV